MPVHLATLTGCFFPLKEADVLVTKFYSSLEFIELISELAKWWNYAYIPFDPKQAQVQAKLSD